MYALPSDGINLDTRLISNEQCAHFLSLSSASMPDGCRMTWVNISGKTQVLKEDAGIHTLKYGVHPVIKPWPRKGLWWGSHAHLGEAYDWQVHIHTRERPVTVRFTYTTGRGLWLWGSHTSERPMALRIIVWTMNKFRISPRTAARKCIAVLSTLSCASYLSARVPLLENALRDQSLVLGLYASSFLRLILLLLFRAFN